MPLIHKRLSVSGSVIGGIKETQDCIDFCAAKNIIPMTEVIKADQLDRVYKKLAQKNDQVLRYVLDCQNSEKLS